MCFLLEIIDHSFIFHKERKKEKENQNWLSGLCGRRGTTEMIKVLVGNPGIVHGCAG